MLSAGADRHRFPPPQNLPVKSEIQHILVVDDDDVVRNAIVSMLQEYPYRVSSASGGAAMRDFLEIQR